MDKLEQIFNVQLELITKVNALKSNGDKLTFEKQKEISGCLDRIYGLSDRTYYDARKVMQYEQCMLESLCIEHDWERDLGNYDHSSHFECTKCGKYR